MRWATTRILIGGPEWLWHPSESMREGDTYWIQSGTTSAAKAGIGFGSALAITISWSQHQSVLWAIIHGLLSWLYVVYFTLTR